MTPKNFFLVKGSAEDDTSELNAFDLALSDAGISQCNLVPVSSILPAGAEEIKPRKIVPGTITFCVLAKISGVKGEIISAGLGYGMLDDHRYGIVVESQGNLRSDEMVADLKMKVDRMAMSRDSKLSNYSTVLESLEIRKRYGSIIAALVYTF